LNGVDYVLDESKPSQIIKKQADLRTMDCYLDNYFDLILAISVIEHVGYDNSVYFEEGGFSKDFDGDLKAMSNLMKVLKSGGRIVVTVPYGRKVDYGWFVHYDKCHLDRLVELDGLKLLKKDLFIYKDGGWSDSCDEDLVDVCYKDNDAPAASGLACLLLQKI